MCFVESPCKKQDCSSNADCMNQTSNNNGTIFFCECKKGFSGDGAICTGETIKFFVNFKVWQTAIEFQIAKSTKFSYLLISSLNKPRNDKKWHEIYKVIRLKHAVIELVSATFSLLFLDNDECFASENFCHQNAICVNTFGSYDCKCSQGYTGDGVNCAGNIPFRCLFVRYGYIKMYFERYGCP